MRNLIFKIYAMFYTAVLLLLFAVAGLAQGTGDSVFAFNAAEPNTEDHAAANYALNQFLIGLMKQYPCVDQLSDSDLAALIGLERMKELLGAEREGQTLDERLKEIAGAVGARYAVTFKATTLPNGQIVISAIIYDGLTGQMIANRLEQSGGGKDKLQTAQSVAKSLLQDLSGRLKGQCEPHWTGSISYTRLIQMSETVNRKISSDTKSKNLSATANIVLQPMTLGFSGTSSTEARVTQNYRYLEEYSSNQTVEIPCREPGRNTYYKKVTGDLKITQIDNGSGTYVVTVFTRIYDDGRYSIRATGKTIKVTGKIERKENEAACRPIQASSTRETEHNEGFYYVDLEGQIDSKNPYVLTGKTVKGDLETGQETWTWNLRLINPDKKKGTRPKD